MVGNISPWKVLEEDAEVRSLRDQMKEYQENLVKKWTWYLKEDVEKGIPAVPKRLWSQMAMMFENQWAFSRGVLSEDTLSTDVVLPVHFALPIIRSFFPRTLASRICAIQTMPLQSGGTAQAFFLNYIRENDGSNFTTIKSPFASSTEKAIPKLAKLTISAASVTATKDILAACWPTEVMEDLKGAHGIDIDPEMVRALSDEIGRELDARLLNEILTGATAGNVTWHWTPAAGHTYKEWYETFAHAVQDADTLIYKQRFAGANYLVLGTRAYDYFCKAATFVPTKTKGSEADSADSTPQMLGAELVGTFNGYWDVYRTVFIDQDRGIVGRYPASWLDAGYIFMPYIPLAAMPLVYGEMNTSTGAYENRDAWTRNVRTRNGKYFALRNLFATLTAAT